MATTTPSKSSTSRSKKTIAPRKQFKRAELEALRLKVSRGRYPATAKDERQRVNRLIDALLNPSS